MKNAHFTPEIAIYVILLGIRCQKNRMKPQDVFNMGMKTSAGRSVNLRATTTTKKMGRKPHHSPGKECCFLPGD